jgi:hypothetical protein
MVVFIAGTTWYRFLQLPNAAPRSARAARSFSMVLRPSRRVAFERFGPVRDQKS